MPMRNLNSNHSLSQSWQVQLAGVPRLTITVFGRSQLSWRFCVVLGMLAGTGVFVLLLNARGISPALPFAIAVANLAAYHGLNRAVERALGRRRIVLLEHFGMTLALTIGLLVLADIPILTGLDAWITGMMLGLACGRIGCLLAGCCYGRAARVGVCYRWLAWRQAPAWFATSRVFPVQLCESLWLFGLFCAGLLLWRASPPGAVFAVCLAGYCAGRFGFEFLRGDARPYAGPLSEAQWICLLLALGLVLVAVFAFAGDARWLTLGGGALAAMGLLLLFARRRRGRPLLNPLHKLEIEELLAKVADLQRQGYAHAWSSGRALQYAYITTSTGLQIQLQLDTSAQPYEEIYRFRGPHGRPDPGTARLIARCIAEAAAADDAAATAVGR
jgi:hypothetical protein